MPGTVTLYDYWRSSAAYRVRIALNLAGIEYKTVEVNLLESEQLSKSYLQRNPQGLVPTLDIDGQTFTQSLAIIEYLNETRTLDLLPADPAERAKVRAAAMAIAIDLHPVCTFKVVCYATEGTEPAQTEWMKQFISPALAAFDRLIENCDEKFAFGARPSLADICLIPQLYNADRWGADYSQSPGISRIRKSCDKHPAFIAAHPDNAARRIKLSVETR
ncbi:MAG: maleylacetoacetate isomerase [Rhizobiaceae bacterium]